MIQTQLLKLDPPYQIISANGYVGIQVATLIVAEEKEAAHVRLSTFSRSYIEYHSYPVVNYGLKRGLEEQMKYNRMPWDDFEQYQIFIEPKGTHLIANDAWKEKFLRELEDKAKIFVDDDRYKIWGLPFYNRDKRDDFDKAFGALIKA